MASPREQSFVLVKPDGVARGLVGEIISRFEKKGFKLTALKLMRAVSAALAEKHYADAADKVFFPVMIQHITSGPVCAMVWEGTNAACAGRALLDAAHSATIRGDLSIDKDRNVCHCSDSAQAALAEIALWFGPGEVINSDGFGDKAVDH